LHLDGSEPAANLQPSETAVRTIGGMLDVRLLGPIEVALEGRTLDTGSIGQRVILAMLALRPGSAVSTDALIDAIWGEATPPTALGTLQVYVSRLRRRVGPDRVVTHPGGYALVDATVDAHRFERLISVGGTAEIDEALTLWRGEPFGDLSDREPFRWEALRLGELHKTAQDRRAEHLLARDPALAAAELQSLSRSEPLRERRWELLAHALAATGRHAEAIRALDTGQEQLAAVGLDASPRLGSLAVELLTASNATAVSSAQDEPITRQRRQVPGRPHPLIGRHGELAALGSLLADQRVVTLVGPGGVGKTSLAQVAALQADDFEDVYWCELAAHAHTVDVMSALAACLEAPVVGNLEAAVLSHLHDRRVLLVLDNCEHLIDEAARVVDLAIRTCPGTTVLATSREPLAVAAERVVEVRPLDSSSSATELFLERAAAAGAPLGPEARSAAEHICTLVDGLPLAVEMAAARVRTLGITELSRRLTESLALLDSPSRTAADRHRTLEDVVEWSAGLLNSEERMVLSRSAVFSGGFDLEAARAVIGVAPLDPTRVAELLGSLVDRSLLTAEHLPDGTRYSMLETVRWVISRHDRDSIGAGERRHATHYARLATRIGRELFGPNEAEWAKRASTELANLRSALVRSLDHGAAAEAIAICAGLHPFAYQRLRADVAAWAVEAFPRLAATPLPGLATVAALAAVDATQRGDLSAAFEWCRRGHDAATDDTDLMDLLEVESDVVSYEGRFEDAITLADRLDAIARGHDRPTGVVAAQSIRALCLSYLGEHEAAARAASEMAVAVAATGSDTHEAWLFYVQGEILLDRAPDEAITLFEQAVTAARRTGAVFAEGVAGVSLASLAARHGDPDTARSRFAETIRRWRATGDWVHQWVTLRNLAVLLHRLGDYDGAALVLQAVTGRGHPPHGEEAIRLEALERSLRQSVGQARYDELGREGRRMTDGEVVEAALDRIDAPTGNITLLMTDMVGSTRLIEAIGDAAWADLAAWHDRTLEALFSRHGGRVMDRAGDGYLVVFDRPDDAVACSQAIQRTLRAHRRQHGFAPRIRIGAHWGTVTYDAGSPRGRDVHLTARVMATAGADEILVTDALAGQVRSTDGEHRLVRLDGIEAPISITSIEWS
jgi:predicted ATPase/class 3 adenylate cyclase/DNA-binding SARP family transcriptional activator